MKRIPQQYPDTSVQPRELWSVFDGYLCALCDPDAGEALHRVHAADAPVRHDDGIRAAASVDRVHFARTHREVSLLGQEVLPKFGHAELLRVSADEGAQATVAWFAVTELREHRSLIAAVGLQTGAGLLQVGWCTLASRVEPWSYREGLLQSLADYPWMRKPSPVAARALLDASYLRQYVRTPVTFRTLPGARFGCQMSTACCKHDFEIVLPPEAQLVVDSMPWQTLRPDLSGTRLRVRPDGNLQLKEVDESCPFLDEDRRCLVHQALGRQPFGPCSVFPFAFAHTPDGISVAMSPICGSVRQGRGGAPADRVDDLRDRLVQAELRRPDAFRLAPDMEISWERFRDIEKALCDCLASDDLPLRRRLHLGSRLLGAIRDNEPADTGRWLSEAPAEISADLRQAIHGMLLKILGWDRAALKSLPRSVPADLPILEVREPQIVARVLQNMLFSKSYSYPYDLTTAYNFLIVLYLLTLVMEAASDEPLSDAMWQELGSLGVHGLLKSVLHDGVPQGFRALFGTSELGRWALAA